MKCDDTNQYLSFNNYVLSLVRIQVACWRMDEAAVDVVVVLDGKTTTSDYITTQKHQNRNAFLAISLEGNFPGNAS